MATPLEANASRRIAGKTQTPRPFGAGAPRSVLEALSRERSVTKRESRAGFLACGCLLAGPSRGPGGPQWDIPAFVTAHSCGAAGDSHPLPFSISRQLACLEIARDT